MKSVIEVLLDRNPGLEFTNDDMCYQGLKTVCANPDSPGNAMDDPDSMPTREEWDICVEIAKTGPDSIKDFAVARSDYVKNGGVAVVCTEDGWRTRRTDPSGRGGEHAPGYQGITDQLDQLYHDIDAGKLDKTGEWYKGIKAVKAAHPKS